MKSILTALFAAWATLSSLQAQQQPTDSPFSDEAGDQRFWQATLTGGEFVVALNRISSVSKHQYVLDGTLVVTEVTIDTNGNALTRIYQITPVSKYSEISGPQKVVERGKELLDQAGQRTTGLDFESMVQKKYPVTTHAKSIEYRVADLATLDALFASVNQAWKSGRGRKFSVNN